MKQGDFNGFFKKFGERCKQLRLKKGWTQEDLLDHDFATRHYQRIEGGLAISMTTALRIVSDFTIVYQAISLGVYQAERERRVVFLF